MPLIFRSCARGAIAAVLGAIVLLSLHVNVRADDTHPFDGSFPTSQPAQQQPVKSPEQLLRELTLTTRQLETMLPPQVLANPAKRTDLAKRAIPVLYHRLRVVNQLSALGQLAPLNVVKLRSVSQALLYLLEDKSAVRGVDDMIASKDPARKLSGQMIQLNGHWIGAADDQQQAKVVDDLEKLDRANPVDIPLTQMTLSMADETKSPELEDRLLRLVTDVMHDQLAIMQKPGLKAQLESNARQRRHLGQPFALAGKTIDGNDFDIANWKGKVVLVDFWATWCAPCRAELPHVLDMFNQYHSKGLEIVGVSSDANARQLEDFLAKNTLPWPQLFDPQTATARLHPLCGQYDINGLPEIFLIDKQGILRSVSGWKQMDAMIPRLLAEGEPATQAASH